ncbi:transketolase [candidate division KSB1 bacterium]
MNFAQLNEKAKFIRREAFEMVINAGRGHLGGSLSSTEILTVLYYGGILKYDVKNPDWEERDIFIMSKGHSNNTLYVVLADLGFFPYAELSKYTTDGALLGGHCDIKVPGIEITTGSLGHGLGIAAGITLGNKIDGKENMTFVILGDGECQEGSVWEAAMFASMHKLGRLVAILDRNKIGSEEFTEKTTGLEPVEDKWKAFGWDVIAIDGHSVDAIYSVLKDIGNRNSEKPLMIIAHTIKGKGVFSLENTPKAHHTLPKPEDIPKIRKMLQ